MRSVTGLHHVTAIAGPAQENIDFYSGILGMRLVKKTVNQDDPSTYHLFYADGEGHSGTDLTFFPWAQMAPARTGHGLATEVSLAVPRDSLPYWSARLERYGARIGVRETRFGDPSLQLEDSHGLRLALVESEPASARTFSVWDSSPVPPEWQIRGLHAVRLRERELQATMSFLSAALGFRQIATEGSWHRYAVGAGDSGTFVDLAEAPGERRGAWGTGAIHHVAFRVDDEKHQLDLRDQVGQIVDPTPVIDRFWFRSVYFKEPGGALFELATDGPGFAVDEEASKLGESLVLPPWLESERARIVAGLPPLVRPQLVEAMP